MIEITPTSTGMYTDKTNWKFITVGKKPETHQLTIQD